MMLRFLFVLALGSPLVAEEPVAQPLVEQSWNVAGVQRTALVHVPVASSSLNHDKTYKRPLVFGFHGHGGSMQNAARSFHLHTEWREAIVVYPQGLPTPGRLTDSEGKRAGWQSNAGHMEDRDLKFFDVMLADLKAKYSIDSRRIYSTGHSNGGGFTYLLWAQRGQHFAAMAPSASAGSKELTALKPKPVLHIASESDPLVKYAWQDHSIQHIKKLNGCGAGKAWELNANCTVYPSSMGCPVVLALHGGGHKYPEEAPAVIVAFFQQHTLPE